MAVAWFQSNLNYSLFLINQGGEKIKASSLNNVLAEMISFCLSNKG